MKQSVPKVIVVLLAAGLLVPTLGCIGMGGCVVAGDLKVERHTVELEDARSVVVNVDMGIGDVTIRGGADALLDAVFTYNVEEWKPTIDYEVTGDIGVLTINQPSHKSRRVSGDATNEWDLTLNGDIPIEIVVDLGVGDSTLDLGGLHLTGLDVDQGVGDLHLNLAGEWSHDADVTIDGGVGNMSIIVPESVGVRVNGDTGVGSITTAGLEKRDGVFANDALGRSEITIDIDVDAGVGSITIETSDKHLLDI